MLTLLTESSFARAVIGEGLFDHLVGSEEQLRWDFGSECLGRLEVEDKNRIWSAA